MLTPAQEKFLKMAAEAAVRSERRTGVPAEVVLAQAILESGWGRSMPPDSNNVFGIKNTDRYPGASYAMTTEWTASGPQRVNAAFEKYPSLEECFVDHARLISGVNRNVYTPHFRLYSADKDVRGFLWGIAAHYATDPQYAVKCWSLATSSLVDRALSAAREELQNRPPQSPTLA
jgi:flagellar protein FlgJ